MSALELAQWAGAVILASIAVALAVTVLVLSVVGVGAFFAKDRP